MANAIEILINARDNASGPLNKATVSVGSLAKAALASAGAFAAAQLSFQAVASATVGVSKAFADEVEQLDRLRAITGLTNQQLQVFRLGLERNGLQANQLGLALKFFQNQLAGNRKEMLAYGITSSDTFEALLQLRGAFAATVGDAARAELASKTLGMRNAELAITITETAATFREQLTEAMKNGAITSEVFDAKMRTLDTSLDVFGETVRGLKIDLADLFGPVLEGAAGFFSFLARHKGTLEAVLLPPQIKIALEVYRRLTGGGGGAPAGDPFGGVGRVQGPELPPGYFDDLASRRTGADIVGGLGALYSTAGPALTQRDSTSQHLMDLSKNLALVDVPLLKVKDDLLLLREATVEFGYSLQSNFAQTFQSLISGTQNVRRAFDTLLRGIMQSITDAIVQMLARIAASLTLDGIGSIIPGPWGKAIRGVGKIIGGGSAIVPTGGNTFVLQSISMKDAYDSLTSITGTMRGAGDRVREVAMAGSL